MGDTLMLLKSNMTSLDSSREGPASRLKDSSTAHGTLRLPLDAEHHGRAVTSPTPSKSHSIPGSQWSKNHKNLELAVSSPSGEMWSS